METKIDATAGLEVVEFFVPGIARPGGSKTGYRNPHTKKFVIVPASDKTKPWMDTVRWIAGIECKRMCLWTGPVLLTLVFYRKRPQSHYRRIGGQLSDEIKSRFRNAFPTVMPDLTKLVRATEDGLTGVIWKDDSQVVAQQNFKLFVDADHKPGVLIRVEQLAAEQLKCLEPAEPVSLFERAISRPE